MANGNQWQFWDLPGGGDMYQPPPPTPTPIMARDNWWDRFRETLGKGLIGRGTPGGLLLGTLLSAAESPSERTARELANRQSVDEETQRRANLEQSLFANQRANVEAGETNRERARQVFPTVIDQYLESGATPERARDVASGLGYPANVPIPTIPINPAAAPTAANLAPLLTNLTAPGLPRPASDTDIIGDVLSGAVGGDNLAPQIPERGAIPPDVLAAQAFGQGLPTQPRQELLRPRKTPAQQLEEVRAQEQIKMLQNAQAALQRGEISQRDYYEIISGHNYFTDTRSDGEQAYFTEQQLKQAVAGNPELLTTHEITQVGPNMFRAKRRKQGKNFGNMPDRELRNLAIAGSKEALDDLEDRKIQQYAGRPTLSQAVDIEALRRDGKEAIAAGADPDAVRARFKELTGQDY